jgi:riboflavin kinase/FMN adenylyltransferase
VQIADQLDRVEVQGESLLTIGAFDGVHRGHQYLIRKLVRRARQTGRLAALLTFYPHPRTVLLPERPFQYLTSPGEKAALFERLGLDLAAIIPFTEELARTPAREFVGELQRRFRMRELWVGRDFALGRDREGDVNALRAMGEEMGFEVHVVDPIQCEGEVVSSTRIRSLLLEGRVREAARLLGRLYAISGTVVSGSRRGKGLGLPTANVQVLPERLVPARGVYATFAWVGDTRYKSVTNIGTCPTFGQHEQRVEVYLLDFQEDLYGYDLVVEFVARLRDERVFPDATALLHQVTQDVWMARRVLEVEPRLPIRHLPPEEELWNVTLARPSEGESHGRNGGQT